MNAYKALGEGGIEELGPSAELDLAELIAIADGAVSDDTTSFGIGLARTDTDFVEVHPVGKDQYMEWSDRICNARSFWRRLTQPAHIQMIVHGRTAALQALEDFTRLSRQEFEDSYT